MADVSVVLAKGVELELHHKKLVSEQESMVIEVAAALAKVVS